MKINKAISVNFTFDATKRLVKPKALVWNNRLYIINKIGLHHTFKKGETLFHVFSVVSKTLFFRLILDTKTLHWKLEEIGDNLSGQVTSSK